MRNFVIVYGSPIEGLKLVGPFETMEDAFIHAQLNYSPYGWWVTEMEQPDA